ncbi:MAG TPA: hypothetical protein VE684_17430 [Crenalkalicoccus sp.]|nr:hypothetical protein [Crenalkalicoccus sp.]
MPPGSWGAVAALCAMLALLSPGASAQQVTAPVEEYLAQSVCLGPGGAVLPGVLPFEPACTKRRALRAGEALPYSKHDWPDQRTAARLPQGYQASDSFWGTLLGEQAAIVTLDFGAGQGRGFGSFEPGDGGVAILDRRGRVSGAMTQDASGVQWFVSPACREARLAPGWLYAEPPLSEAWRQDVAMLLTAKRPEDCPRAFVPSLTRWRLARIALPWREAASGEARSVPADILVSEHYGHMPGARPSIATAAHLERTVFARGLGVIRWERWENPERSTQKDIPQRAAIISDSSRCPAEDLSVAPGTQWRLVDCRLWTNFVRAAPGAPLQALPWPPQTLR